MEFYFDFGFLDQFSNPLYATWTVFVYIGWIPVIWVLIWGAKEYWLFHIRRKYASGIKTVLLAIDVPKNSEQSPKAAEHIFSILSGALAKGNWVERNIKGKIQENFSFEIASHNGYIRFYANIPVSFRDLVEAAIYAQYPDAELTECNDYVDNVPHKYPDAQYDLWGSELCLAKSDAYPIKTYPLFEHTLSQTFKDPLAALLEVMARLSPGEELWFQLVVLPIDDSWKERGVKQVKKLIGQKVEVKKNRAEKAVDNVLGTIGAVGSSLMGPSAEAKPKAAKEQPVSLMQYLSPGEKEVVAAIQAKIAKIGFLTKLRLIYVAPKEVFSKGRGVSAVLGAIGQFNSLELNSFKTDKYTKTAANYFFKQQRIAKRQNKLIKAYKGRSTGVGGLPYVLNIEELATIFHFPTVDSKASLVKKIESKKGESPANLPFYVEKPAVDYSAGKKEAKLPSNLPFA